MKFVTLPFVLLCVLSWVSASKAEAREDSRTWDEILKLESKNELKIQWPVMWFGPTQVQISELCLVTQEDGSLYFRVPGRSGISDQFSPESESHFPDFSEDLEQPVRGTRWECVSTNALPIEDCEWRRMSFDQTSLIQQKVFIYPKSYFNHGEGTYFDGPEKRYKTFVIRDCNSLK